jgi:hypothetical protein
MIPQVVFLFEMLGSSEQDMGLRDLGERLCGITSGGFLEGRSSHCFQPTKKQEKASGSQAKEKGEKERRASTRRVAEPRDGGDGEWSGAAQMLVVVAGGPEQTRRRSAAGNELSPDQTTHGLGGGHREWSSVQDRSFLLVLQLSLVLSPLESHSLCLISVQGELGPDDGQEMSRGYSQTVTGLCV